jgi:hypothetical protein
MNRVKLVIFPFRRAFERLRLCRRWWHRLFIVLFFAALPVLCLWLWVSLNQIELEAFDWCYEGEIRHEYAPGYCAQLAPVHRWMNLGIGFGVALLSSYLLQIAYRLGLYIAFGKISELPDKGD